MNLLGTNMIIMFVKMNGMSIMSGLIDSSLPLILLKLNSLKPSLSLILRNVTSFIPNFDATLMPHFQLLITIKDLIRNINDIFYSYFVKIL